MKHNARANQGKNPMHAILKILFNPSENIHFSDVDINVKGPQNAISNKYPTLKATSLVGRGGDDNVTHAAFSHRSRMDPSVSVPAETSRDSMSLFQRCD